jgi:polysaccharide deacetylase family protein (PEP-CTERM system associated)
MNTRSVSRQPTPAMSIDVEDWFHVANLRRVIRPHTWADRELRVERSMNRMLALLADANVKATCFILGWVAERFPWLVRSIAEEGHEVASHGHSHDLLYDLRPWEFRRDIERSKAFLEDITGAPVQGYRAPNFSITDWAIPILEETGFSYDSSLFPTTIAHDRYGRPSTFGSNGDTVFRVGTLTEISLSCLSVGRHAVPWAGGGYFRLLPYPVFRAGVRRILGSGKPYVFYIHPWELDPGQPRVAGLERGERFRHYLNIEKAEARWASLLRDFRWTTISELVDAAHEVGAERGTPARPEHQPVRAAPC